MKFLISFLILISISSQSFAWTDSIQKQGDCIDSIVGNLGLYDLDFRVNSFTTGISTNGTQLILSYPGFDGGGRCVAPAFVINIYEKIN